MEDDATLQRRAKAKAYRDANPERMAAQRRADYERNKESYRVRNRKAQKKPQRAGERLAWQRANKEKVAVANRKWQQANLAKFAEYSRLRGTLLYRAIPCWYEVGQVAEVYERCRDLNEQLGLTGRAKLSVDHIIPLNPSDGSVCGLHCLSNLQLLCKSDNSSKRDTYTTDW